MTDFEDRYMNETVWLSPPVYTHDRGYKIRLAVYVNGRRGTPVAIGGRGTHVSVMVHFMRGEFDDSLKWPFRGAIIMFQTNRSTTWRRSQGVWISIS